MRGKVITIVLSMVLIAANKLSAEELDRNTSSNPILATATIERTLTYQGLLKNSSGNPVPDASYNITFRLYDISVGGTALWNSGAIAVTTSDGYFTRELGPINLPFDRPYYLSLQVASDAEMTARQKVTMTAYSAVSDTANYAFGAPGGGGSWTLAGNILSTNAYYGLTKGGSGNVHYGDSTRSMVNFGAVCTTGTSGLNVVFATIGGGRANKAGANFSTIGGGYGNKANGFYTSVAGGDLNLASGVFSTVGGGIGDTANGAASGVFSGYSNVAGDAAEDTGAFIGGGSLNNIESKYGTISGGYDNIIKGLYGAVAGGLSNYAGNNSADSGAFVGAGRGNFALGVNSVVGGGNNNGALGAYTAVTGGHDNISTGSEGIICGGGSNLNFSSQGAIAGGYSNQTGDAIEDTGAFIGGGRFNRVNGKYSVIAGGRYNTVNNRDAFIGSGLENVADMEFSVVVGGLENIALASASFVGGGGSNTAGALFSTIAGGAENDAGNYASAVCGGEYNNASNEYSAICGGQYNTSSGLASFVGGGVTNAALGDASTVAGGLSNIADGYRSVISGGGGNYVHANNSAILGGHDNSVDDSVSAICGGAKNRTFGIYSIIPGGACDTLGSNGDYSMVFGREVYINNDYRVAFFDGTNDGNFNLNRDERDGISNSYPIHVGTDATNGNGAYLTGGGVWTNGSSRTFKENFTTYNGAELLAKISNLSIVSYNYKNSSEKHFGPMAEDFVGAFDVGAIREDDGKRDDMYISSGDVAGVALAGVQELLKIIEGQNLKIEKLENEIYELKAQAR